jgi:hypothetical protein
MDALLDDNRCTLDNYNDGTKVASLIPRPGGLKVKPASRDMLFFEVGALAAIHRKACPKWYSSPEPATRVLAATISASFH